MSRIKISIIPMLTDLILIPSTGFLPLYSSVPLCADESFALERLQALSLIGVFKADLVKVG
jgi:hypothetical protein